MTSIYDEMLPTWTHPTGFDSASNYVGTTPVGYCIYSQNRESSILDAVNFKGILEDLGGESEHVSVIRHGHWACGWIEYIMVSKNAPTNLLDRCVGILRGLANRPVYSDDAYSDAVYEAIADYWHNASLRERIERCKDVGVSFLRARHSAMPDQVFDQLRDEIY